MMSTCVCVIRKSKTNGAVINRTIVRSSGQTLTIEGGHKVRGICDCVVMHLVNVFTENVLPCYRSRSTDYWGILNSITKSTVVN